MGIAEADVGAVFDRFRQASNLEVGHGGSGLGLAIARELCLIHGGGATVQSQLGTGSAFRSGSPWPWKRWFRTGGYTGERISLREARPRGGRQRRQPLLHRDPADIMECRGGDGRERRGTSLNAMTGADLTWSSWTFKCRRWTDWKPRQHRFRKLEQDGAAPAHHCPQRICL